MLSHFSRVQFFASLWTVAHQTPLSMGFSRQEYWSGLPCPPPGNLPDPEIKPVSSAFQMDSFPVSHQGSPVKSYSGLVAKLCSTLWDPMDCSPPSSPWDFPGKNTGEGCHFLLQGIFPTQGLKLQFMLLNELIPFLSLSSFHLSFLSI